MKAILINARLLLSRGNGKIVVEDLVNEVEVNPKTFNEDVTKHLGCRTYERVPMAGVRHDRMFVDEEGWLHEAPKVISLTPWCQSLLAGNILIACSGKTDVSMTVEEIRYMVLAKQIRFFAPEVTVH